jgi:hypothetical protein
MTIFLNETQTLRARSKRWREINAKRDAYQKLFEDVLADGMAAGAFRPLPITLTALGMLGAVTWAYRWYSPDGLDPDEIADLYVDIVLQRNRGVAPEVVDACVSSRGLTAHRRPRELERGVGELVGEPRLEATLEEAPTAIEADQVVLVSADRPHPQGAVAGLTQHERRRCDGRARHPPSPRAQVGHEVADARRLRMAAGRRTHASASVPTIGASAAVDEATVRREVVRPGRRIARVEGDGRSWRTGPGSPRDQRARVAFCTSVVPGLRANSGSGGRALAARARGARTY